MSPPFSLPSKWVTDGQIALFGHLPHLRFTPQLLFQHSPRPANKAHLKLLQVALLSWTHRWPELHTIQLMAYEGASGRMSEDAVVNVAKGVLLGHLKAHENIVEGTINLWHRKAALSPYRVVLVRRPSRD